MNLGSRIQALRKQQGLSQEELADRLGLSRQAIGKWESGSSMPSIDNLIELSSILQTSVDYLLTGREPEPLSKESESVISAETLQVLLAEQKESPRRKRLRRSLTAAGTLCLILAILLLAYYIVRLDTLEATVSDVRTSVSTLDSQMQGSLSSIQAGIEDSLTQQASILSDSDFGYGAYDADSNTATVYLSATPKTLTEDTALYFVLSPISTSQDTLEQAITAEAHIPASDGPSSGIFTAEVQIPMVQDFEVSVILEQDGLRHTEIISQQYGFSSMYLCTLTADSHDFSWTYSNMELYTSGSPAVTVTPATALSAPLPDTLTWELYVDDTLVYTQKTDLYRDFFSQNDGISEDGLASAVSGITFYGYPNQDGSPYACQPNPSVRWHFVLTDTAGNTFEDSMEW